MFLCAIAILISTTKGQNRLMHLGTDWIARSVACLDSPKSASLTTKSCVTTRD